MGEGGANLADVEAVVNFLDVEQRLLEFHVVALPLAQIVQGVEHLFGHLRTGTLQGTVDARDAFRIGKAVVAGDDAKHDVAVVVADVAHTQGQLVGQVVAFAVRRGVSFVVDDPIGFDDAADGNAVIGGFRVGVSLGRFLCRLVGFFDDLRILDDWRFNLLVGDDGTRTTIGIGQKLDLLGKELFGLVDEQVLARHHEAAACQVGRGVVGVEVKHVGKVLLRLLAIHTLYHRQQELESSSRRTDEGERAVQRFEQGSQRLEVLARILHIVDVHAAPGAGCHALVLAFPRGRMAVGHDGLEFLLDVAGMVLDVPTFLVAHPGCFLVSNLNHGLAVSLDVTIIKHRLEHLLCTDLASFRIRDLVDVVKSVFTFHT